MTNGLFAENTDHPTDGVRFREGLILPGVPSLTLLVGTGTDLSLLL